MGSLMSNTSRLEDGRTENPDLFIFIAKDKSAKPFARFLGAPLPIQNRHVFAPADNAEIVDVFRQVSGQFAVYELVASLNLIHGKRHGNGEILDELSILAIIRILDEIAPKGLGCGPYFLVGLFNDIQARFSGAMKDRIC